MTGMPPSIRYRDSVSFYLVIATPSIILQVSGNYSPSQWCSVGCVTHNLRLPNLKDLSYGVMALRFISG